MGKGSRGSLQVIEGEDDEQQLWLKQAPWMTGHLNPRWAVGEGVKVGREGRGSRCGANASSGAFSLFHFVEPQRTSNPGHHCCAAVLHPTLNP